MWEYLIPEDISQTLERNIFFFSGFKTHHEMEEVSMLLRGDDGGFKPFPQFLQEVKKIDRFYNSNYLRAEYNFATASSQMAVKWHEWAKDGDRYDLQYRTAGDDRVREEHIELNGITLPFDDPFWKEYLPPNSWNCRCTTVQVRKGKYPLSDSDKAIALGANATSKPKQKIFRFNPGAQKRIFPPKHPYFPKNCGNCKYKLVFRPNSEICQFCKNAAECWLDKKKTDSALLRKHYEMEMEHLLKKKIPMAVDEGKQINVSFDKNNNRHLYSDTFKRASDLPKDELKNIDKILAGSTFIGSLPIYKERNDDFDMFYYFKTSIDGIDIYLHVGREIRKRENGKIEKKYILHCATSKNPMSKK